MFKQNMFWIYINQVLFEKYITYGGCLTGHVVEYKIKFKKNPDLLIIYNKNNIVLYL